MRHAPKPSHQREHLQPRHPWAGRRSTAGFTLIEMLVVVIIIAILAGMVLGLFKIGNSWEHQNDTNDKLARLRAVIEEFHNEYGKYPPVDARGDYGRQPFGYEYAWTNGMSPTVLNNGFIHTPGKTWGQGPLFTFGLMSFLVTRYAENADNLRVTYPDNYAHLVNSEAQWRNYNATAGDQARDVGAINGWRMHLGSIYERQTKAQSTMYGSVRLDYTNRYLSVLDDWRNELNYQSDPPYTRYRLWSNGPDGISGTADDLSTGAGY